MTNGLPVSFEKYKLRIPIEVEAWPKDRAERVSVNAFGMGGVNAHVSLNTARSGIGHLLMSVQVILESPQQFGIKAKCESGSRGASASTRLSGELIKPNGSSTKQVIKHRNDSTHALGHSINTIQAIEDEKKHVPPRSILLSSAYSADSLNAQIEAYQKYVEGHKNTSLHDLAYTLANRREHKPYRAYIVTNDANHFGVVSEAQLVAVKAVSSRSTRVAWVFTGQGAQWPQMGAELIDSNITFRATIRKLDRFLQKLAVVPWSIEGKWIS